MIEQIKQEALDYQMEHLPFTFPLVAKDNKIVFKYGTVETEGNFSRNGMNLFLQKFTKLDDKGKMIWFIDRDQARLLHASEKTTDKFVSYVNECRRKFEDVDLWRKNQTFWIAVNNGVVSGVMANYNPKSNLAVVEEIEAKGLANQIKAYHIKETEMVVYLGYKSQAGFTVGLAVCNGETGHTALSYRLYVDHDDYTFTAPNYGKRKHLSKLERVEYDLREAYDELSEVKFHDYIMTAEAKEYAKLILDDEKFKKLHEHIEPFNSRLKKLYQVLGFLASQRHEKGFKTVCSNALDALYKEIVEHI